MWDNESVSLFLQGSQQQTLAGMLERKMAVKRLLQHLHDPKAALRLTKGSSFHWQSKAETNS